jgi:hypothetical protein
MKKRILLFTAIAGMCYLIFCSYQTGPGANGYECTGAETDGGNPTGCSAGASTCHGAPNNPTASIGVSIALDSAGIPMHYYTGGVTYKVKITGTNGSTDSLPRFGIQMGAIKGTTTSATPVNAGTWSSTTPANTHYTPAGSFFLVNVVEHSSPLLPTTGTGRTGSTIVDSFTWTAPPAGTGLISIWGAVNAVNFNTVADAGDLWNTAHIVIPEGRASLSVASVAEDMNIKAFPNPTTGNLNLHLDNAQPGAYALQVIGLNGSTFVNQNIEVNSVSQATVINTGNWAPGLYSVVVEKDGIRKTTLVVKQ